MDHPTVMYLFKFVISPIGWLMVFALAGLGWAMSFNLLREKNNLVKKFGKDATEWMVG